MPRRSLIVWFFILVGIVSPGRVFAQSTIAGLVRDTTGAVLPGVTVEAASPALIERIRSAVTDEAGQYKIIDLRPGTYSVTFTLTGFNAIKREGVELPPNFTASVNVEMRVGTMEETITVSGAAPAVDVQSAVRSQVLNAELLNALPTARNFQTLALALPGLKAGGFDVGGSTQQQQGVVVAAGGSGLDQIMMVDGMNVMSWTGGKGTVVYHNVGGYQEMAYQSFGTSAEMQSAGVIMNMVPKTGGNRTSFDGVVLYANSSMEGHNQTPELLARGFTVPGALAKNYDVNGSVGFPVKADTLWWFTSVRYWTYDRYVANQFYPDGQQAIDDNITKAFTNRMTWQVSPKNKLTAIYDKLPRTRYHSGIENGNTSPEATPNVDYDLGYIGQAKYTGTLSNRLLVEAGWSSSYYRATSRLQSLDQYPSAGSPYGAISHNDTTLNQITGSPATYAHPLHLAKPNLSASVAYVTGSHAFKTGVQFGYGVHRTFTSSNADLQQLYRNGVPYAVNVYNTPTFARTKLKHEVGLFAQDSWTLHRLTMTPGVRFESLEEGFPVQDAPDGRFVAARHFESVSCIPCWRDVVFRLGVAYDFFGNGTTAIKGSVGSFTNTETYDTADLYNPMNVVSDQRAWTDPNRDDIAQNSEIGPSQNSNFGIQTRFPADDLKRPYQMLYSLGGQHQLTNGVSASATYYHRRYRRLIATENTLVPIASFADEFTPIVTPDPRGNGANLTVYNLKPQFLGLVHRVDYNSSTNYRTYDGFDITLQARLPGRANLVGGTSTGKFHRYACEVENPNSLRFCDARQPFTTAVKLSGSVPLKYGFRFSGIFQSMPGQTFERDSLTDGDIIQTYVITRAVIPALTVASVSQRLNEPGKDFMPRVNQLDLSISRQLRVGRTNVSPQIEIFNALNASPETSITQTFGSAYGRPLTVLPARLLRVGLQVSF